MGLSDLKKTAWPTRLDPADKSWDSGFSGVTAGRNMLRDNGLAQLQVGANRSAARHFLNPRMHYRCWLPNIRGSWCLQ